VLEIEPQSIETPVLTHDLDQLGAEQLTGGEYPHDLAGSQ
jgi:hypothetical protein